MSAPERRSWEPTHDEMEALFVNNASLDRIKASLNRFNPIRTMKMERMEIRHSAILAWLLDPAETHGFGDAFLKAFLGEALRGTSSQGKPNAIEISQSNLRDAEVRREWQNIDIFVLSPSNNWAFIIENKLDTSQRDGQLLKYVAKVGEYFKDHDAPPSVRGIFLTLHEETPADDRYAPIRYHTICDILSRLMEKHANQLAHDIRTFLNHYVEIILDATGMSKELTEMERLARQLYREHKKVLDFVVQKGASSDFAIGAQALFGDNPQKFEEKSIVGHKFVFSGLGNNVVSFMPLSWYKELKGGGTTWTGCENWWSGLPLIAWFQLSTVKKPNEGIIWLYAEVGPLSNHNLRKALIVAIQEEANNGRSPRISFQKDATAEGKLYSKFFKENTKKVDDVQDADKLAEAMKALLEQFIEEFTAVARAIPKALNGQETKQ